MKRRALITALACLPLFGAGLAQVAAAAPQSTMPAWLTMDAALGQLATKWEVALEEGEGDRKSVV